MSFNSHNSGNCNPNERNKISKSKLGCSLFNTKSISGVKQKASVLLLIKHRNFFVTPGIQILNILGVHLFLQELEKPPPDKLHGLRVHCWVLVLSGKREVPESFFIEALTGQPKPLDYQAYLGIECVWNNTNLWVNMQDCSQGIKVRTIVFHCFVLTVKVIRYDKLCQSNINLHNYGSHLHSYGSEEYVLLLCVIIKGNNRIAVGTGSDLTDTHRI